MIFRNSKPLGSVYILIEYILCPNFIAELIRKSKIMKPYHEIIKKPDKYERFDKKKILI